MTPAETIMLCRLVKAVCPAQALDQYSPDAWHLILGHLSYADAKQAVVEMGSLDLEPGKARYIEPGHIVARVKRIRAKRLSDHGPLVPPPGLDGPAEYLAWLDRATELVASGGSLPELPELPANPDRSAAVVAGIRKALPSFRSAT